MKQRLSKRKKTKLLISTTLIAMMLGYIGYVFYLSEPNYIDNCRKPIEKYDWVVIPAAYEGNVKAGVVLQRDDLTFILKIRDTYHTELYAINIEKGNYKIIGEGTIYHKINDYVGMNIMVITQIMIGILCGVLMIFTAHSIVELLED